jgi:hypothetical protein
MCYRIRGRDFAGPEDHGVARIFGQRWCAHLCEQCFAQSVTFGCHGMAFRKATLSEAISSDKKKPLLGRQLRPRTSTDDRSVLWRHYGFAVIKVVRPTEATKARDRCPALLDGHEVAVLGPAKPIAVCRTPAVWISLSVILSAIDRRCSDQDGGSG